MFSCIKSFSLGSILFPINKEPWVQKTKLFPKLNQLKSQNSKSKVTVSPAMVLALAKVILHKMCKLVASREKKKTNKF